MLRAKGTSTICSRPLKNRGKPQHVVGHREAGVDHGDDDVAGAVVDVPRALQVHGAHVPLPAERWVGRCDLRVVDHVRFGVLDLRPCRERGGQRRHVGIEGHVDVREVGVGVTGTQGARPSPAAPASRPMPAPAWAARPGTSPARGRARSRCRGAPRPAVAMRSARGLRVKAGSWAESTRLRAVTSTSPMKVTDRRMRIPFLCGRMAAILGRCSCGSTHCPLPSRDTVKARCDASATLLRLRALICWPQILAAPRRAHRPA